MAKLRRCQGTGPAARPLLTQPENSTAGLEPQPDPGLDTNLELVAAMGGRSHQTTNLAPTERLSNLDRVNKWAQNLVTAETRAN